MAKSDTKKFLKNLNNFVNSEYKRGALDKFKTRVVITRESLAQGLLEGYQDLFKKRGTLPVFEIDDFYPIAESCLNSAAGWANNPKTRGTTLEFIRDKKLVYIASRDIKRPYTIIKNKSVSLLNKKLKELGHKELQGATSRANARSSEIGIFKSGTHRGHQGVTTVGAAQLSAALKFLDRTKSMGGFAESAEAKELSDIFEKVSATFTTEGTKASGGRVSLKEGIVVEIELEPRSANLAGSQYYDYKNLKPKLEKAISDYVRNNNIENLPGSASISKNALNASEFIVLNELTKAYNVKGKVPKYSPRGKKSEKDEVVSRKKSYKGSGKKAKNINIKKGVSNSPLSYIQMFNTKLPQALAANMQNPRLNYQTGRFADSVKVVDVNTTTQGFLSFGYTYQKNPYQTFEPGFAQGDPNRDPRKLIDKSMRDIAVEFAMGRFYTRRV